MAEQLHRLKTIGIYWDAVKRGDKLFEVRRNDRFFQAGDVVQLMRLDDSGFLEGAEEGDPDELDGLLVLTRRVGPVLQGGQFGLEPGYCVFSLLPYCSDKEPGE